MPIHIDKVETIPHTDLLAAINFPADAVNQYDSTTYLKLLHYYFPSQYHHWIGKDNYWAARVFRTGNGLKLSYQELFKDCVTHSEHVDSKPSSYRYPILNYALSNPHTVELLLNFGAEANAYHLTHAAENNYIEVARILLQRGVELSNHTIYAFAEHGHTELVITNLDKDKDLSIIQEAIFKAAEGGQLVTLIALLDKYLDQFTNQKELINFTFYYAVTSNKQTALDLVRYLLNHYKAEMNVLIWSKNKVKGSTLFDCKQNIVLKYLLEQGANPNIENDAYGCHTPLCFGGSDTERARLLVLHKADPEFQGFNHDHCLFNEGSVYQESDSFKKQAIRQGLLARTCSEWLDEQKTTQTDIVANLSKSIKKQLNGATLGDITEALRLLKEINTKEGAPKYSPADIANTQCFLYEQFYQQQAPWWTKLVITVVTAPLLIPLFFTIPWLRSKDVLQARKPLEGEFKGIDNLEQIKSQIRNKTGHQFKSHPVFKLNNTLRKVNTSSDIILMTSKQAEKYDILRAAFKKRQLSPNELIKSQQQYQQAKI